MIFSRSPLRITFAGGGSDYREFTQRGGTSNVIGCALDQYVYVMSSPMPSMADEPFRFTYRRSEVVHNVNEFLHPVLPAAMNLLRWTTPVNIATMADLPGGTGLGSSSAFVTALLANLNKFRGERPLTPESLARAAVHVERDILQEPGGVQDQYQSAFGGFRHYKFSGNGNCEMSEAIVPKEFLEDLSKSLLLVAQESKRQSNQGALRTSQTVSGGGRVLAEQLSKEAEELGSQVRMSQSVDELIDHLATSLSRNWQLKQSLLEKEAGGAEVEEIVSRAVHAGALAGKLCGAGGAGFVLLVCPPEDRDHIAKHFDNERVVRPSIAEAGTSAHEAEWSG